MLSVTQRIHSIKQPYKGYLPVSSFGEEFYNDARTLNPQENIHGSFVGLAVDYLTRFQITNNAAESFEISMRGAEELAVYFGKVNHYKRALELLESVQQGDIAAAVKLTAYDGVFRAGVTEIDDLNPDSATIENISIMVKRGVDFLNNGAPIVKPGFTFEGGYTDIVSSGDGDYLTQDTLIDFKVLRGKFNKDHTLQILMYYLMELHSVHKEFQKVERFSLFNPRKNFSIFINVKDIEPKIIQTVSEEIIGYR